MGWDARWLSLQYRHDQGDERLLEGEKPTLDDAKRDMVRLDLRGGWGALRGSANARYTRDQGPSVEYDELSFGQEAIWKPTPRLQLSVNLREIQREFRDPSRTMDILSATARMSWRIRRNWRLRLFSEFRHFDNSASDSLRQRDLEFGVLANLRFGAIEVDPNLSWTRRERGESEAREIRGMLRIRRRF